MNFSTLKTMKSTLKNAAITAALFGVATFANADTYVGGQFVFSGKNVYGPSVINDGGYQMWHSAWQDNWVVNDTIYYRTSTDNVTWTNAVAVYSPQELEAAVPSLAGLIEHVTDPSVTKHINGVTGQVQYTMFFTVCKRTSVSTPCDVQSGNEIWSAVSSDGQHWFYPQALITGSSGHWASEPSAVIDPQPNGTFWKVYYDDRTDSSKVKMVGVGGNRSVVYDYGAVLTSSPPVTLANPEVKYFNGQWHLFANHYTSNGQLANIYKVQSSSNESFDFNAAQGVVMNAGVPYCGTVAPGVLPVGGNQYDIYFGLIENNQPGATCNMAANTNMVRFRFAE